MSNNKKNLRNSMQIGDVINVAILLLLSLICLYPFWYIFIGSISNPNIPVRSLIFFPKDITSFNYVEVFKSQGLIPALMISLSRTILGTIISVILNSFMGYLFTLNEMPARKFFYRMVIVTMYVSGGLIPTFLVYKAYGLTNNFLVYILPGAISAFNIVLIKTYMENGIPYSLSESAILDGAGPGTIFIRIIFPLSIPIVATIALFCAVGQWNSWFDNQIYTSNTQELTTLQFLLYKKLNEANALAQAARNGSVSEVGHLLEQKVLTPDSIRMTITMIVTLPIIFVYPFVQKYFVKGIMVGAVKG